MREALTGEEARKRWLSVSFHRRYFRRKHKLRDEHDRLRKVAELQRLSRAASNGLFFGKSTARTPRSHLAISASPARPSTNGSLASKRTFFAASKKRRGRPAANEAGNTRPASMKTSSTSGRSTCVTAR